MGSGKYNFWCGLRKDADFVLLKIFSGEDNTEADNDQKRKSKIPAECSPVAKEFFVSGSKHYPDSADAHDLINPLSFYRSETRRHLPDLLI